MSEPTNILPGEVQVPRHITVSIRKWSFWPISASICTFVCAATTRPFPRKLWISLIWAKKPHFRIETVVWIGQRSQAFRSAVPVGHFHAMFTADTDPRRVRLWAKKTGLAVGAEVKRKKSSLSQVLLSREEKFKARQPSGRHAFLL